MTQGWWYTEWIRAQNSRLGLPYLCLQGKDYGLSMPPLPTRGKNSEEWWNGGLVICTARSPILRRRRIYRQTPALRHYHLGAKVLSCSVFKLGISQPWQVVHLQIKFSKDDTSTFNFLENGWTWLTRAPGFWRDGMVQIMNPNDLGLP